jgi:hypothetical protein
VGYVKDGFAPDSGNRHGLIAVASIHRFCHGRRSTGV